MLDTSAIPFYATAISVVAYGIQRAVQLVVGRHINKVETFEPARRRVVTAFLLARAVCCLTIFGLVISLLLTSQVDDFQSRLGLAIASGYIVVLSSASLLRKTRASAHLHVILVLSAATYIYRDIYPLVTYTNKPLDAQDGWRGWTVVTLLIFAGIVGPLTTPAEYTPLDDEDPTTELNSEQKASPLARLVYTYLDAFTLSAIWRSDSIPERIPALSYKYKAKRLRKASFPFLDPFSGGTRKGHMFWSFIAFYRREVSALISLEFLKAILKFAGPVGINRLLAHLEGKNDSVVHPWVWIVWLFMGPLLQAIASEAFTHLATRNMVSVESILTQLIFEHSLRVRFTHEPEDKTSSTKKSGAKNITGKINTLATADMNNVASSTAYWITFMFYPVQILLSVAFLYAILGWSAFVALAVLMAGVPILTFLTKRMRTARVSVMKNVDARVQKVSETMSILRMIKFFAWEPEMRKQINDKRVQELHYLMLSKMLELITGNLNFFIPVFGMLGTYATFTLVMHRELSASVVFSSLSVFEVLRQSLRSIVQISGLVSAKVSLDRIDDFLHNTELLDAYTESSTPALPTPQAFGISNAEFTWTTTAEREFKLRVRGTLSFSSGLSLITGPTGSGKTSLLMALLGEMHYKPPASAAESWFNVPRVGGVAYVAQESWVLNATIRDNILFGAPYDEERYNEVLFQCALGEDLELLGAGDQTEVGEKGLTLSGGQKRGVVEFKARVSLARAVYSRAEIVLMDDILAALDVHTAKWIVNKCLKGKLLKGRTVLLTTHNIPLTRSLASMVVRLDSDGVVAWGSVHEILGEVESVSGEVDIEELSEVAASVVKKDKSADSGKLVMAEEREEGHVGWAAFKLYMGNLSKFPTLFWIAYLGCIMGQEAILSFLSWYMGYWASQYEHRDPSSVSAPYYLKNYTILLVLASVFYSIYYSLFTYGSLRASRVIHSSLVDSVTAATLRWLDSTPSSRVITRATVDMNTVDSIVAENLNRFSQLNVGLLVKFVSIIYFSPKFIFPGLVITALGGLLGQIYIKAQLPVKRVSSIAKAPVVAHFGSAIHGVVSIRAYGAQEFFLQESLRRLDVYLEPTVTFYTLNRWICIRTDALAGLFTSSLAFLLVYGNNSGGAASNTGFSITTAMVFSGTILLWVRTFNRLEVFGNSLERILRYINADQEPKPSAAGMVPAYWPSSGSLRVDNLCARYSKDGPEVLHNLSFEVKSGEHIGIVGRTGSGKSSLTLSLLRCIPTEGEVYYDDLPTHSMNLDTLRSNITIIPQMPELLSGTLRYNLDPFGQYEDHVLNDALRSAGLFSLQAGESDAKITLESNISGGGNNLSVGQRQILALARAIVRRSKLLILDEATSAIDFKTDAIIQQSLRNELGGVTLLTIAHRLQTIMDFDRILVLDAGHIVEFDSPSVLLKKEDGWLRSLVDESSDKQALYAAVGL